MADMAQRSAVFSGQNQGVSGGSVGALFDRIATRTPGGARHQHGPAFPLGVGVRSQLSAGELHYLFSTTS